MRNIKISLIFILTSLSSFCQGKPFEIFGTISGNYNSKMYLFFEGNTKQRDSISSEIKDGKFYFKGNVAMPILARLHMDQESFIRDIYIDNRKTYVACTTNILIFNNGQDTMNRLAVINIKGSATDKIKSDFEKGVDSIGQSKASEEEQRETYYQKLAAFIKKHPKSKLSPYLLGKASSLSYSQVKKLSGAIDTSLNHVFEMKSVTTLLARLDKAPNKAIGLAFQDVVVKDSNGHDVDTRQFRGKYTLIVCWASWCKPCRAQHPGLNSLFEKYKDKGFEMIGLSLDKDGDQWKKAIAQDKLNWTQTIDPNAFDGETAKHYGIEAIPSSFLLDKDGKVLGVASTVKDIDEMISKFL